MKKILLIMLIVFFQIGLKAQQSFIIDYTEQGNNYQTIQLYFRLQDYYLIDTILPESFGTSEIFCYISMNQTDYGNIYNIGRPLLPQITGCLNVPRNAKDDIEISYDILSYENHTLSRRILPAQALVEENNISPDNGFVVDNEYYLTTVDFEQTDVCFISQKFIVFGEKGMALTITPFVYSPLENKLTIINEISINLTIRLNESSVNNEIHASFAREEYLNKLFINYSPQQNYEEERYLIVTNQIFLNTIAPFALYKQNLGYDVNVMIYNNLCYPEMTAPCTYDSTCCKAFKQLLKTYYDNISTRPDFILLVGDYDFIPAIGARTGLCNGHPITDNYYACLDGDDVFADVFLGRFSVSNNTELANVINKTISMESNLNRTNKKALLLAGNTGNGNSYNYLICQQKAKSFLQTKGYECCLLSSDYQDPVSSVLDSLENNYNLIIYRGHGIDTAILYRINSNNTIEECIDYQQVYNIEHHLYPFMMSLSCNSGNFGYDSTSFCFGESWIRSGFGGCAFWGASKPNPSSCNDTIEAKVLKYYEDSFCLSEALNLALKEYYYSGIDNTIENIKWTIDSYNLLGDPSFRVNGIGCQNITINSDVVFDNDTIVTCFSENSIAITNGFIVRTGSDVEIKSAESIILNNGFFAENGSVFYAHIGNCYYGTLPNTTVNNMRKNIVQSESCIKPEKQLFVFPNPVGENFTIEFELEKDDNVLVELYNINGQKLKTLLNSKYKKGKHTKMFSIKDYRNGIYVLIIKNSIRTYNYKIIKS